MPKKIKKYLQKIIMKAENDKDILAVALFGSYARKEYYRDIDVCLILKKKLSSKDIFDKRMAYLFGLPDYFDVQIFQNLPLYVRIRILKEGKILACKNEDELYELALQTVKDFESYKKIYYMYLESIEHEK